MSKYFYVWLAISLVLTACAGPGEQSPKPQFGTWGVDTSDMDRSVRPGNDFFEYALGSWVKAVKIPDDEACAGAIDDVDETVENQLRSIVEQAAAENAGEGPVQQIGDLYTSYMDEGTLDARGV